jgi:hypothetical protein
MINFKWGIRPPVEGEAGAGSTALELELKPGTWKVEWLDTKTGQVHDGGIVEGGGVRKVVAPAYETDIALRLRKR